MIRLSLPVLVASGKAQRSTLTSPRMIRLSLPVLFTSLVTNIVYPGTVRKG